METDHTTRTDTAGFAGRILAVMLGLPIWVSMLGTLPAVGALIMAGLYIGVPAVVRRAVNDPVHQAAGS